MRRFLTPFVLPAMFSPEGAQGGASGAGDDASAAGSDDKSPASLAEAAGIDPDAASADKDPDKDKKDPSQDKAAGDPASDPAADGDAGEGDGGDPDKKEPAGDLYQPDTLPEDFRGANDQETIDKLLADRPVVPETPADYKYDLTGAAAKLVGNVEDDPILAVWREVSKEFGYTNEQSNGGYDGFLGKIVDKKLIPAPVDYDAELKLLEPSGESDPSKAGAAATARIQASLDFVKGMKTRKHFDQDETQMFLGLANSAKGVGMLEKMQKLFEAHGIQFGGEDPEPEQKTQADTMFGSANKGN